MNGEISRNSLGTLDRKFQQIKVFAFDVDGVYTDGLVQLSKEGIYNRSYATRDGFATQYAIEQGVLVWILTGGRDTSIQHRFCHLGVKEIFLGETQKEKTLQILCDKYKVALKNVCYMGDDIPDLEAMKMVGVAACPSDACRDIRAIVDYVSPNAGGRGCVRDVIEHTLRVQKRWLVGGVSRASG